VGFATVATLRPARAALLQYLAVAADARSRGVGTQLLESVAHTLHNEGGLDGILIEIEDPHPDDSTDQARRRLRFYQRAGAQLLHCLRHYFSADFTADGRIPMLLLWRPLADVDPPTGDALRVALREIFSSEYADAADRDFLDDMLAEVIC
jgi:GNAT superfamily N-acetyltransferase